MKLKVFKVFIAGLLVGAAGKYANGQSIEDVETWPERNGAVTVEAVNAAAQSVFGNAGTVTTRLTPSKKTKDKS